MSRHTDSQYEEELAALGAHFSRMGSIARSMMEDAVRALLRGDAAAARAVIARDAELDRMENEVDERCVAILARRAPVGADLRFVTAVMKCVVDVERIGDLAVNVAKRALDLVQSPGVEPGEDTERLAHGALGILTRALDAFAARDSAAARSLYEDDRALDAANRRAFHRLIAIAQHHPDQIERALAISGACRNLERAGDHAVNIGERVVFMVEGEEVRHRHGSPRA